MFGKPKVTNDEDENQFDQLLDSGECAFCGGNQKWNFSQKETMILMITAIKYNPMIPLLKDPDFVGFYIGYLRTLFCPDVTVEDTKAMIHGVDHIKKILGQKILESDAIWDEIGKARVKLFAVTKGDHKYLADDSTCTCKCHKDGKPFCYNCAFDDPMAQQDGIWHVGYKNKRKLFQFAKEKGLKLK